MTDFCKEFDYILSGVKSEKVTFDDVLLAFRYDEESAVYLMKKCFTENNLNDDDFENFVMIIKKIIRIFYQNYEQFSKILNFKSKRNEFFLNENIIELKFLLKNTKQKYILEVRKNVGHYSSFSANLMLEKYSGICIQNSEESTKLDIDNPDEFFECIKKYYEMYCLD